MGGRNGRTQLPKEQQNSRLGLQGLADGQELSPGRGGSYWGGADGTIGGPRRWNVVIFWIFPEIRCNLGDIAGSVRFGSRMNRVELNLVLFTLLN
uniref:Uncharacterized protein n=1 Tax=Kalanchoe fedtschenkoi TaxID=63787 RepID=A0A7N0U4Y8_KALFE